MVLVLLVAGLAVAAAWQIVTRTTAFDTSSERRAAIAASAARVELALVEIAVAERGYVAPGQGLPFWASTTDDALTSARGAVAALEMDAGSGPLTALRSRLDTVASVDARARRFAQNDQRNMASDLIFADGSDAIAEARAALAAAVPSLTAPIDAALARDRQVLFGALALLSATALIALLLLARTPKPVEPLVTSLDDPATVAPRVERDDDAIGAALDASLADLDAAVAADSFAGARPEGATAFPDPSPAPAATAVVASPRTSAALPDVADVCVDLARLLDARDLEPLLARAASVLDAPGLIVWMVDDRAEGLTPALAHGYDAALMARLARLPRDADNATAAAWRAGRAQVVDGALAVPLLTAAGCSGVLAIELADKREHDEHVQALARIIAAQLAATVVPAAAETDARKAASS